MFSLKLQLSIAVRTMDDGAELAEPVGWPEISCIGETQGAWERCIAAKVGEMVKAGAASALTFHRRLAAVEMRVVVHPLRLDAPKRRPDWREAVDLQFHAVEWEEGGFHHAYIPAVGVHVLAPRPDLLPRRVGEHLRLVLLRSRRVSLAELAATQRVVALRVERLDVPVSMTSPVEQIESSRPGKKTDSVLEKAAVNLCIKNPSPAWEVEPAVLALAGALGGPHPASVLLVGGPGVGKTAILHELVRERKKHGFGATTFWSTNGARLIAGQSGFGQWQERCRDIVREAGKGGVILHLGNLAELAGVGRIKSGDQSIADFLRPAIARGEILAVAECTPAQLAVLERTEPALAGSFLHQEIAPPGKEATRRILGEVWNAAEGKTPEPAGSKAALDWLHRLHLRYATYSANPGRPIRFLRHLLSDTFPEKSLSVPQVTAAFTRETGLPAVLLDDRVPLDVAATQQWFSKRVIGQPAAVERVLDVLATVKARLARPRKPLASLLLIGPTGTGKTELGKSLAEFLFGDVARLTRFDLSEFSTPSAVQRLFGGDGGDEGLLTARIREQPFSVLLLDEFEKADSSFFDLLLQILGDARLTDAAGRVADFSNCVIVMTSNLGAQAFQRGRTGFRSDADDRTGEFDSAVRSFLRPEIYNRMDAVIPFLPLSREVVREITRRQLDLIRMRDGIRLRALNLEIAETVVDYLAAQGYEPKYGARPLKRAIEREFLTPLAATLNGYAATQALSASVVVGKDGIKIVARALPAREAAVSEGSAVMTVCNERRRIQRFSRCSAVQTFENEVALLPRIEARLRRKPGLFHGDAARLESLRALRDILAGIQELDAIVKNIETEAMMLIFQREPFSPALFSAELAAAIAKREALQRRVLRQSIAEPDRAVFALYGDDRAWFERMFAAYLGFFSARKITLTSVDVFTPAKRRGAAGPDRTTIEKLAEFPMKRPEGMVGMIAELRGDFVRPMLEPEAGRHVWRKEKSTALCVVEVRSGNMKDCHPPCPVGHPGALAALNLPLVETWRADRTRIERGGEEIPWATEDIAAALATLVYRNLHLALEALVE